MPRNRRNLNERNKFYILTNGRETEKNYFDLIKSKRSIYDVKVEYQNYNPAQLVQYASQYLRDANQVWCVFDIDNNYADGALEQAIRLSDETGVQIAYSNMAFEVWLLSHYQKVESSFDNARLIRQMNKLLKDELGLNCEYDKSDKELLKKYFLPNVEVAVENSKVIYQRRVKQHEKQCEANKNYRVWEWNSSTNVFQLIEALKLQELKGIESQ